MSNFDPSRAIELMQAVDSASDTKEAMAAFEAAHVYLLKHDKGFRDIYGNSQVANIVDLQDQGRIAQLEEENKELTKTLGETRKELKIQEKKASGLAVDVTLLRLKTAFVSACVGAAAVGGVWIYNSGKLLLSARSELAEHYETKEREMITKYQGSVTSYNQKKDKLDGEYAARTRELNEQAERSLDKRRKDLKESFDLELEDARFSFRSKLQETQPFRAGTGQYGYIYPDYNHNFQAIYSQPSNVDYRNESKVVAKVEKSSCLIITGVSDLSPEWTAVTQIIQGRQISGYVSAKNITIADVGPIVDCVARKAMLAHQGGFNNE